MSIQDDDKELPRMVMLKSFDDDGKLQMVSQAVGDELTMFITFHPNGLVKRLSLNKIVTVGV